MNAKWHIINHLACAVVFLSVCSFSAFSQERDTIFIIEHDTVWMDLQPDAVIESQTRENRYDRRVHRYRRHWEASDSDAHQNSVCRQYGVAVIRYRMGLRQKKPMGNRRIFLEYCPNMTPNVPS